MINEAHEPSSACRLWRVSQVETSTPPNGTPQLSLLSGPLSNGNQRRYAASRATPYTKATDWEDETLTVRCARAGVRSVERRDDVSGLPTVPPKVCHRHTNCAKMALMALFIRPRRER